MALEAAMASATHPVVPQAQPTTATARQIALEAANASLRLEGLTASPEADTLMQRWVSGELDEDELMERVVALHRAN